MSVRFARLICIGMALASCQFVRGAETPSGLRVEFSSAGKKVASVLPNVQLYIPEGTTPSPLLAAGPLDAVWTGYVNADLRGDFRFKAEARGTLKVEINGKEVLQGNVDGKSSLGPSGEIRLNKGQNQLRVSLKGPKQGAAFVRLLWSEYGFLWEPIHRSQLTRDADDAGIRQSRELLHGRELFLEGRCAKCHTVEGSIPDLEMDAPSFGGIGSRRNAAWMAKWILNPQAERATAQMPAMLHGKTAAKDAEAIAAYLATLKDGDAGVAGKDDGDGKSWAQMYHCTGCHTLPGSGEEDLKRISLDHVNEKFPAGHLASFLMAPAKHYQWRRMPNFGLSDEEAVSIAAFLRRGAAKNETSAPAASLAMKGRELVQNTGCLNCHQLDLPNKFEAKPFSAIATLVGGCLSEEGTDPAPAYAFTKEEQAALKAFATSDRKSLERHVPLEFAERQAGNLRCTSCHGQLEGFPPLERLGGKLKPEYMTKIIAGETEYSPRPWLDQVMPAFKAYSEDIALGLAHSHGYPSETPKEGPVDPELAKIGRQLVGVNGGFSCISCHGVGDLQPTQVFEAEGVNLAMPARRLQKDYYIRWLLNPLKIEPQTKMPVYFGEDGASPLFDVLEGNAMKQLEAFWQYMRAGDKINPPKMDGF